MNSWIIPYIKKYRWRVLLSALYALLGVVSGAMLLFVSGYLISKSSLQPENIMAVYVPIVSVRAFSIGQAVFPYLERLVSHDIVLRILSKYRDRMYAILEPQAMLLQSRFQTGDLLTMLSDDIEKLQDFYIKTVLPSFAGLVVYIVFSITIGIFDIPFMLLMLAMLGIIIFLMPLISYFSMVKKHKKIKTTRSRLYEHSTDSMFGQLDWLVSGRVDELINNVTGDNRTLMNHITKINRWHYYRNFLLHFTVGLIVIAVMIWSDYQTSSGTFSPTIIAAFVLMMFAVTDALLPISDAIEEIPTYDESIQRMNKLEVTSVPEFKHESWNVEDNYRLKVNAIRYQYPQTDLPIIDDITFTIEPGEKVAILGRSGAGKSTLLKLLSGILLPTAGDILIGNQKVSRNALAKSISVLNQKPHLFHTTVANNVRIGDENASDGQIQEALKQAEIFELIESLPDGIHTQMEEMGKRFSGGERQRIAFARALIQQTPIILLDEPTTGLDPLTEMKLIKTFITADENKTIILVTHHLAGAELMDKIIFIEDGKIKLQGSHKHLMNNSPYYRTLYEMDQGLHLT